MSSTEPATGTFLTATSTHADAKEAPGPPPLSPAVPVLSAPTSISLNPQPAIRAQSESSIQSAVSPLSLQVSDDDVTAQSIPHAADGGDEQRQDLEADETTIDVTDEETAYDAAVASPDSSYLSLPIASPIAGSPTTSPLQLTISLAAPAPVTDSLVPPSAASNSNSLTSSSSASHLIDMPPHSPPLSHSHSREHSLSLSHQRPSVSVRRLSVSHRGSANERTQEDEEEVRWLTQANPFAMAELDAQQADEQKEADMEADESDAYDAAEMEEKDEVEAYEEHKLPSPPPQEEAQQQQPVVQFVNQTSLLPPIAYGQQRIYPTSPPQRPSSHHISHHISLSYDPRSREPSLSRSSLPLSPSPTPSLSAAGISIQSELPPSPALVSRPLIMDRTQDSTQPAFAGQPPPLVVALPASTMGGSQPPRVSPANRRRLQKKIGFALAEHDEDDEDEEVKVIKPELRPIKPQRRTTKQREAERKEKERRKRQQEKDVLEARERRFLARDIQDRIGSFPRPLLQAVLSCLLTSPPVATLSNLSSSYALTSGQHVLLDLSGLAGHWSSPESSLPDELAHGLSVLLGTKAGVVVCNERTSMRDVLYGRKEEDEREEKYGGGGMNGGRGSVLSIASLVSSSSTSSPASPTGPLFCPLVVLHNLHLAPHSLHSTLISAGRLGAVTIEGSVVRLPRPSLLVATHSQHIGGGLWCGGSGFSARQLMELFMYDVMAEPSFPSQLRAYLAQQPPMPSILSSRTALEYSVLLPPLQSITCSQLIRQYVHDLIATLRQHVRVAFGPSPSTAHSLLCAASTHALFSGVGYVTPHDVDVVAAAVLAHRITLRMAVGGGVGRALVGGGVGTAGSARAIVQHLVTKVLVPPK